MDWLSLGILILLTALTAAMVWHAVLLRRKPTDRVPDRLEASLQEIKSELIGKQMEGLATLRESLDSANRLLNDRLADGNASLDRRMGLYTEIENKLGQLEVQTKNIETIGQNIQSLSSLLKPPKLRGALGETLLENLLAQVIPRSLFETQYRFSGGQIVDVVVKLSDRLLPIDSKFPLETFQRFIEGDESDANRKELRRVFRKHIDDISGKYIRPEEQTTDFALMYIPSEAVYHYFVTDDEGLSYALGRRVIPSSPGHLYAFLATLAAVYAEAGLVGEGRRLGAGLASLAEALQRLIGHHEKIEGSMHRVTLNMNRLRDEAQGMNRKLEDLRQPQADQETE